MKFRKKPVVIDAVQWTGENAGAIWDFYPKAEIGNVPAVGDTPRQHVVMIHTLEGTMTAQEGDWIIRGVQGEFYPCKPDIFTATYESVEPAQVEDAGATPSEQGATESAHPLSSSSLPERTGS